MRTSAVNRSDADHRPTGSGYFDQHRSGDVLTADTMGGAVRSSDAGDLTSETPAEWPVVQDARSRRDPTGMTRSRRRSVGAGWWLRRLAAATTPLLFSVAMAAPAFAWPECAC